MLFSYATLICGCLLSIAFLFLFDHQFKNLFNYSAIRSPYEPKDSFAFEQNQDSVSKKDFRSIIEELASRSDGRTPPGTPLAPFSNDRFPNGPSGLNEERNEVDFANERFPKGEERNEAQGLKAAGLGRGQALGRAFPFDALNWNSLNINNIRFQSLGSRPEEFSKESRPKTQTKGTAKPPAFRAVSGRQAEVPIGRQESQLGFAKFQFPPSTQLVSQGFHFFENERKNLLQKLDQLSFRAIGIGFPFLTIGILSGSVWANEAWGSYWNWDPKETWSLITWIIFAIYLHLRFTKNWDGLKSAILATIGFLSIWICFLGVNFLAKGLHSYGWFH